MELLEKNNDQEIIKLYYGLNGSAYFFFLDHNDGDSGRDGGGRKGDEGSRYINTDVNLATS